MRFVFTQLYQPHYQPIQPTRNCLPIRNDFRADGITDAAKHPSNDAQLNKDTVQRIFLSKEKAFTNGKEAIPVNIQAPAEQREAFDKNIIEKNESQMRSYWSMVVFSGKGTPPKEVPDEKAVVELVSTNPNVIGYVSSAQATDKVKTVFPF